MRYTIAPTARAARLLLLLLAVIGIQPVSTGGAAEPASPAQVSPAALLAGPPAPLPVYGVERQGDGGDGRASAPAHDPFTREQAGRAAASSACTAGFCPWRAFDALARSGRHSSPSTAPPTSSV